MVDMSAIGAIASSLNVLKDIAHAMVTLRDAKAFDAKLREFNQALMEAYGHALAVQTAHAALIDRVRILEEEVVRAENWEAEKQRYELKELHSGSFAYTVKETMRGAEPVHSICATCRDRGEKSILQRIDSITLQCPACKAKLTTGERVWIV